MFPAVDMCYGSKNCRGGARGKNGRAAGRPPEGWDAGRSSCRTRVAQSLLPDPCVTRAAEWLTSRAKKQNSRHPFTGEPRKTDQSIDKRNEAGLHVPRIPQLGVDRLGFAMLNACGRKTHIRTVDDRGKLVTTRTPRWGRGGGGIQA